MKTLSLVCYPGDNPELLLDYLKKENVVYIDSLPYEGVDLYGKSKVDRIEKIKNKVLKRVKRTNFK